MKIVQRRIEELIPYERNQKKHDERQIANVANSLRRFGWKQPVVIDSKDVIVVGHCRVLAAQRLGLQVAPCVVADDLTEDEVREFRIADNKTNESDWDLELLRDDLQELSFEGFDFDFDLGAEENSYSNGGENGILQERFLVPPFSVLDGRNKRWLDRKAYWEEIIGDNADRGDAKLQFNRRMTKGRHLHENSILDSVLAEIAYKWFTPQVEKPQVFDCFAGDTIFGYVSAYLGAHFTGIELRQEQCEDNRQRTAGLDTEYICDDGRNVLKHIGEATQDLLFSCPPYFDLQVYSDKPNDASNQETYEQFYAILDEAFANAIKCLKQNRFAVIVVGDIRSKKHTGYYDFIGDIKRTFMREGCLLYNDIIKIDPCGTAGIRAANYMKSRKVVKVHQNVLVFYKGTDWRNIANEYADMSDDVQESMSDESEDE